MIRKILKWTGIILLVLVALVVTAYAMITLNIKGRAAKKYEFKEEVLSIPHDSISLARGRHLTIIKGCQDCHGSDLAGKVMIHDGGVGILAASNLTRGKGGLRQDYAIRDWVMALRHGVDRNGHPLIFMPSHETTLLAADDMAAIIAYCREIPPVDREMPAIKLGPVAHVMGFFDKMPLLSVEKIDHNKPMIARADTSEGVPHGQYLAISCSGCHRADFKGGDPVAPGLPPVPDLTSTGNIGKWSQEQFVATLRTGKTPTGHQLKNGEMPWQMTAQYEQKELASLYQFFRNLP